MMGLAVAMVFFLVLFILAICLILLISTIFVYRKAGYAGWEAIVPVYSTICLLNLIGWHPAMVLISFVPLVNFIFLLVVLVKVLQTFNASLGLILLVILLPFIGVPIWAFSNKYQYEGVPC